MTYGTNAPDLSNPPTFMATWKSNLPIVLQSMKVHPLLIGLLAVGSVLNVIFPLAFSLIGISSMIAICFIEYTVIKAVWANIHEGAPSYPVTQTDVQWRMVLTQVILNVCGCFMTLFLFVPGFWFASKTALSLIAVVVENRGPRDAIARSFSLTKGHFWKTAFIYLIFPALMMVLAFVAMLAVVFVVIFTTSAISKDFPKLVQLPLQAILTLLLYGLMITMKPPTVHLFAYLTRQDSRSTADTEYSARR